MNFEEPNKFAIHAAAREGRSVYRYCSSFDILDTNVASAAAVESFINVSFGHGRNNSIHLL